VALRPPERFAPESAFQRFHGDFRACARQPFGMSFHKLAIFLLKYSTLTLRLMLWWKALSASDTAEPYLAIRTELIFADEARTCSTFKRGNPRSRYRLSSQPVAARFYDRHHDGRLESLVRPPQELGFCTTFQLALTPMIEKLFPVSYSKSLLHVSLCSESLVKRCGFQQAWLGISSLRQDLAVTS